MSQTPLTDAYLASRCKGENKQSWVEFARGLELKIMAAKLSALKHENEARQLADRLEQCLSQIGIDQIL